MSAVGDSLVSSAWSLTCSQTCSVKVFSPLSRCAALNNYPEANVQCDQSFNQCHLLG